MWLSHLLCMGHGSKLTLKCDDLPLPHALHCRQEDFSYLRNLWRGAHIDTCVIGFLNELDRIVMSSLLHQSPMLLFDQQKKKGPKTKSEQYTQYPYYKDIWFFWYEY